MSGPHKASKSPSGMLLQEAAALHRAGDLAAAEEGYRRVLKKDTKNPDALHLLGVILGQRGDLAGGLAFIEQAVLAKDNFPDAHVNASAMATKMGDWKRAEHHARKAATYRPNLATYQGLGNILLSQGRRADAVAVFRAAHEREPSNLEARLLYGRSLRFIVDPDTMLAVAESGLALVPDQPTFSVLAAEALFAQGRLREGWHAYRARFRSDESRVADKAYPLPFWAGEDLSDRAILVWGEQGPGDEVMYANMYADLVTRARRCVFQCHPRLATLMRRSFPTAEIVDRNLTPPELTGIDFQCPAGSLGEWLRPTAGAFPTQAGYLQADHAARDAFRAKYLGDSENTLLVGIAWRSANVTNAAEKSINVLDWGPILNVPNVKFVNLQYGDTARELHDVAKGFRINVIQDSAVDPLRDLDLYAAQVSAMDVVVSSSNTAAHIAGALGIPTLCMLPETLARGRRWYWLERDKTALWYPATRLFAQGGANDWLEVIRDTGLALLDTVVARCGVSPKPYLRSMGKAFADMGRPADAEALYLHLAAALGYEAEGYWCAGDLRKKARDAAGALEYFDRSISADPRFWHVHNSKGSLLASLNRFQEAIDVYRAGLAENDTSPELHNNLAKAHAWLGQTREAIHHYERALVNVKPGDEQTRTSIELNYAAALHDDGSSAPSLNILENVLVTHPDHVDAHFNRAQVLLSLGRFEEGWREFAWRFRRPETAVRPEAFPHIKLWAGEPLTGKKVLIWTEQGIGDEILVGTMIPDAIKAAREVVVLCSKRLIPLFRRSFQTRVDERAEPLPASVMAKDFDFQMSLSELGLALRPTRAHFPIQPSILTAGAQRHKALRAKYTALCPGNAVVGVSWSSEKNYEIGWLKGTRVEAWGPILKVPGITFVNLQYGDQTETLTRVRESLGVDIYWDRDIDALKDMDAFAAQVAAMDTIISVSNTTVHTAGALGVPITVMLGRGRGQLWYWLQDGADSPWYPSVRLVRHGEGGWHESIERCAAELRTYVSTMKASSTP